MRARAASLKFLWPLWLCSHMGRRGHRNALPLQARALAVVGPRTTLNPYLTSAKCKATQKTGSFELSWASFRMRAGRWKAEGSIYIGYQDTRTTRPPCCRPHVGDLEVRRPGTCSPNEALPQRASAMPSSGTRKNKLLCNNAASDISMVRTP